MACEIRAPTDLLTRIRRLYAWLSSAWPSDNDSFQFRASGFISENAVVLTSMGIVYEACSVRFALSGGLLGARFDPIEEVVQSCCNWRNKFMEFGVLA